MAIYAKCLQCDKENGDGEGKATEILRRALAHVAKTGHPVEVSGTPASVVKDQKVLISRV